MSNFIIKVVRDGHTFLKTADSVEIFESGQFIGVAHPFVDVYEGNRVRERIEMNFAGTLYIENISGKTVKTVRGIEKLMGGPKDVANGAGQILSTTSL
jgi:hypothetical protein